MQPVVLKLIRKIHILRNADTGQGFASDIISKYVEVKSLD